LSTLLALLLDVMNDRGEFHLRRTRHRGGWAELAWWCPQGRDPRWNSKMSGPCVYASQNLPIQANYATLSGPNKYTGNTEHPGKNLRTPNLACLQLGIGCQRHLYLRREGGAAAQPCAAGTWRGRGWRHSRRRYSWAHLPRAHVGTGTVPTVECAGGKVTTLGVCTIF
jgi:hypothetical protein